MKEKFLLLHDTDNYPAVINIDAILCIESDGSGTEVTLTNDNTFTVSESPEKIYNLIQSKG